MRTLQMLSATNLAPYSLGEIIDPCETEEGYCDFSVDSKVDDYMGTAKRTSRDKPITLSHLCFTCSPNRKIL